MRICEQLPELSPGGVGRGIEGGIGWPGRAPRVKHPEIPRPFRTPSAPLVGLAGMLTCGYLLAGLPGATWRRFATWTAMGVAFYALYGRFRAHRHRHWGGAVSGE